MANSFVNGHLRIQEERGEFTQKHLLTMAFEEKKEYPVF